MHSQDETVGVHLFDRWPLLRAVETRRIYLLSLFALVAMHIGMLVYGLFVHFPTRNEVAHVPAGLAIWNSGTFALYRVNPPLPRVLAVLPVLAASPDLTQLVPMDQVSIREEWDIVQIFAQRNASNYLNLMRLARVAGICWSLAACYVVWKWSTELYGPKGGLLGVGIWCLDPLINAHAQVVTADLPASAAGLIATYAFRNYLKQPEARQMWLCALALGVAQVCKFTLLVLYPAWALIAACHAFIPGDRPYRQLPLRRKVTDLAQIVILSTLVINAAYLFEGSFVPLGSYSFNSDLLTSPGPEGNSRLDNRFHDSWLGVIPVPLPYHYLSGIDLQRVDLEGHLRSYLRGTWSHSGWWYFYLYALLVKTPLGILLLVFLGMINFLQRPSLAAIELWIPALAILTLLSSQTGYTHHVRYALPAIPFILIATVSVSRYLTVRCISGAIIILCCLTWSAISVLRIQPHTLSYFNELAGGPDRGHEHLLDSNIDWGQDLLLFKWWAEAHAECRPLHLAYANFVDPEYAGVDLPPVPPDPPCDPSGTLLKDPHTLTDFGPHAGYHAIDLHTLAEGNHKYLTRYAPVATIGYTIHIYFISPQQVASARQSVGLLPLPP